MSAVRLDVSVGQARLGVDEAEEVGPGDERCAAVHVELLEQVLNVRRDGLRADRKLRRDLLGVDASGEQLENLALPARQALRPARLTAHRHRPTAYVPVHPCDELV